MRAKPATVVCWGEIVVDLAPGRACLGGGAANVARNLAALGAEARLVSAVGGDAFGRAALDELVAAGVDVRGVTRLSREATACAHVAIEDGAPRYRPGARLPWQDVEFGAPLEAALADADAVVFALFAQSVCLDLAPLARAARPSLRIADFGLRRDVARSVLESAAELTDVIQLDAVSAERAARVLGASDAARALLEIGEVRLVIETRAERGARFVSREGDWVRSPPRVARGTDGVGAGDAFVAAVTAALLERAPLDAVLDRALEHALADLERARGPLLVRR